MKNIIFPVVAALTQSNYAKPFFITLLMLQLGFGSFVPAGLTAQVNTFSFLYESPPNKGSFIPIQVNENSYIVPISLFTGVAWAPSDLDKAFLMKFTPVGDTSGFHYMIPDTTFSLTNIISTTDGGFLVAGSSKAIGMDSVNLLLLKLNNDLEVEWQKHHYLYGNWRLVISRLLPFDDNGFIIAGHVCMFPCAITYPYLARIDQDGNILLENIYNYFSGRMYEYILNPAKNRIWMFAYGLPPNGNGMSVTVFDTAFAFISSQLLQTGSFHQPYFTKWINDTSFIFSYLSNKDGASPQDHEFSIQIRDTSFNVLQYDQFGVPDSDDYPAYLKGLDFQHPDTIFYAATIGIAFGPPLPEYTNWFMIRQSDGQLQERYRHFYGGDAYYEAIAIIATSDGGCFVSAKKFNHDTGNFELFFLKLNSEGMLVGTNDPEIQQRMSLLYPNPATDEFVLETYLDEIIIKLFDVNGTTVRQYSGVKGENTINLRGLPAGVYVVSIYSRGNFVESHKLVKNPG